MHYCIILFEVLLIGASCLKNEQFKEGMELKHKGEEIGQKRDVLDYEILVEIY